MLQCFDCNSPLRADVEYSILVILVLYKFWILVYHILVESTVVQLEFYFFVYNIGFMGCDFHITFFCLHYVALCMELYS